MSKEAIGKFYNYVQTQPELETELNSLLDNREVMIERAVELAGQNNYIFTKEELEEVITNLEAAYAQGSELSDEQLEAIAGGKLSVNANLGIDSRGFHAGLSIGW